MSESNGTPYEGDRFGVPKSEPVPQEYIDQALREFHENEEEYLRDYQEMLNGGGRTLEEFLPELFPELEAIPSHSDDK